MGHSVSAAELSRLDAQARQATLNRHSTGPIVALVRALPAAELIDQPWLLLALGRHTLRQQSDFIHAADWVNAAEIAFERQGDAEGCAWVAVEWAVLGFYMNDPQPGLEAARRSLASALSERHLRASLKAAGALCLAALKAFGEAERWLEEALDELAGEEHEALRQAGQVEIYHHQALVALAQGEIGSAQAAAQAAVTLLDSDIVEDLAPWCYYALGLASWRRGELGRAAAALDTARDLAETSGHTQLWCWILAAQGHLLRDQGELAAAREAYRLAESWGEESYGPTFLFLRESQLAEARWSSLTLLELAMLQGAALAEADARVLLALIALRAGRAIDAAAQIERAAQAYTEQGHSYRLASARLYQASVLYSLEELAPAEAALAEGLAILARQEAYNCEWWVPDLIESLLFRAIQSRIELRYARRMLNQRFLNSLPPLEALSASAVRAYGGAEMELARKTQLSMLPASPPLLSNLDIAAISLAAEDVGGDFYGYYPLENPRGRSRVRVGLALGDIVGKGLAAALLSSGTAVALATATVDNPEPSALLDRVQTALQIFTRPNVANVAICYVTLDRKGPGWLVRSANAGAIPPFIRRADGRVVWMPAYGLPLGASRDAPSSTVSDELGPGDMLLLVSDGVVEAMSPEREIFGFERLEESLRVAPVEQGARGVVAHLLTAVQTHASGSFQHDDTTFLVAIVPPR
jgi:tetratricopeptide (TPR) repeat protein